MIDIKQAIKEKGLSIKFSGVAPEGFVLVHEETLENLKDFDVWKEWKNHNISIEDLNKTNFEKSQNAE